MSRPESAGLSGPRLQHIDRFLQQKYLDTGKLPCALTLVERNGQVAHLSALGRMDVERNRPLQEDTIFRIYSMTKPLTSLALMMLVEEGRVALDDPVHRYIPQWRELGVYEGGFIGSFRTRRTSAPMRVIDLMRHTSGLTYGFQQRTNVDAAYRKLALGELPGAVSLERMIEELAKVPLEFSPGTAFNYSVSTDVVGYLVGKISGEPFEQFLRTRIIDPLGMVDTDFMVPAAKAVALRRVLRGNPRRAHDAAGRSADERFPAAARFRFRRRRPGLDRRRLPALLQDAAQWRRARRRAPRQSQDAGADVA